MLSMIIKMSLVTALYVAITAALWLWVHGKRIVMTNGKRILIGVLYGICAVLSTHFGVVYETMALNVRDIAPLAAGLFFDPYSGIIAGLIGGIERYIAGTYFNPPVGAYTRIACSVSTCLAGFLAAFLNRVIFKGKKPSPFYAFFMGAVMEVFHMYVVFITHRNDMNMAYYVVDTCAIPMIIFTGIGLAVSSLVLYLLVGRKKIVLKKPKDEELPISVTFQFWLFICTMMMLVLTFLLSYSVQTRTVVQNARNTMTINSDDEKRTYEYLQSDYASLQELIKEQTLIMARAAESGIEYFGGIYGVTDEDLAGISNSYKFYEMNVVDENGIVIKSTNPLNLGYDMYSADQSKAFMKILSGEIDELAQDYMPIGRDSSISLMYVGVKSGNGLIQVALDSEAIDKYGSTEEYEAMFGDRHIGENGNIYIFKEPDMTVVSGTETGKTLKELGILNVPETEKDKGVFFEAAVKGIRSYCRFENFKDGYGILAALPLEEVYRSRNMAAYETAFADILLFSIVFLVIYILVQKIVVNNLDRINASLAKITKGNLDEVVDVRSSSEFAVLSEDINHTVTALKGYIEQAEKRIEEELEFARAIQSSALPKVFTFPRDEFEIYALMDPAKEVGGDFYDFFFIDANKMALVIADVSGKGIPAALFMMRSKTAIKSLAESGRTPSQILEKANNVLCEGNDADMFVTAWVGIVDLETGKVVCANAGHEYPAIMRANGDWELFKDKHGLALAAMEDMPFKEYEMQIEPGDRLFVYTDGVPEAIDENDVQFGTDEMLRGLNAGKGLAVKDLLPFVRKRIANFVGEADQFDDITMIGFEFKHFTGK